MEVVARVAHVDGVRTVLPYYEMSLLSKKVHSRACFVAVSFRIYAKDVCMLVDGTVAEVWFHVHARGRDGLSMHWSVILPRRERFPRGEARHARHYTPVDKPVLVLTESLLLPLLHAGGTVLIPTLCRGNVL